MLPHATPANISCVWRSQISKSSAIERAARVLVETLRTDKLVQYVFLFVFLCFWKRAQLNLEITNNVQLPTRRFFGDFTPTVRTEDIMQRGIARDDSTHMLESSAPFRATSSSSPDHTDMSTMSNRVLTSKLATISYPLCISEG